MTNNRIRCFLVKISFSTVRSSSLDIGQSSKDSIDAGYGKGEPCRVIDAMMSRMMDLNGAKVSR
jgi:hypothetical protein